MARERRRQLDYRTGKENRYNLDGTFASTTIRNTGPFIDQLCQDDVGFPVPHSLNISNVKLEPGRLNGRAGRIEFVDDYVPDGLTSPLLLHLPFTIKGDATTVLARSNPNKPAVDLPVFIAELRDLPKLVKLAGNSLLGKAASANLSYQFGWKPLISDLQKLLNFSDHVARKRKELDKLHSGSGLKRRIKLDNVNVSAEDTINVHAVGAVVTARRSRTTTAARWGTVRWRPVNRIPIDDPSRQIQAIRLALGLDITFSTLWELIPFSWLVDWYANVGEFLTAHRNTVPVSHGVVSIMTHTATNTQWVPTYVTPGYTWSGARQLYERKQRTIHTAPALSASIPFLDGRQLSILASLSILRAEAWKRR